MILKQVFKTSEGARKRCAFENRHSADYTYEPVRMYKGLIDSEEFKRERFADYTWKINRVPFHRTIIVRT